VFHSWEKLAMCSVKEYLTRMFSLPYFLANNLMCFVKEINKLFCRNLFEKAKEIII